MGFFFWANCSMGFVEGGLLIIVAVGNAASVEGCFCVTAWTRPTEEAVKKKSLLLGKRAKPPTLLSLHASTVVLLYHPLLFLFIWTKWNFSVTRLFYFLFTISPFQNVDRFNFLHRFCYALNYIIWIHNKVFVCRKVKMAYILKWSKYKSLGLVYNSD